MKTSRIVVASAVSATLITSSLMVAPALATSGLGFSASPIVTGTFGTLHVNTPGAKTGKWGLMLKTLDNTDISADRLTIQPSGYSGWHAHPGPVFVTVTQGSITWYDGADPLCTGHNYTVGQSFIENAYGVHNVRNASTTAQAQFVAITIKPVGFVGPPFRLDRPQPTNCAF
ncbi:MAG TPA: cupin domain-containing protein [Sphingomicrobium sp.]|nr:cupin domain-containing protein [Sphingomicrobium sp.]